MRLGCHRFRLPIIRRERFWLYKRAKTILALNLPVTVELVDVDWFRSSFLSREAIDVDVAALVILHREDLFQDVDSAILLLACGAWGCSRTTTRLLIGAIPCGVAGLVALET